MRCIAFAAAVLVAATLPALSARADGTCPAPPPTRAISTWGAATTAAPAPSEESSVAHARDLLARARLLDEAASADERSAGEIATRLPVLRTTAKAARARADRAAGDDREVLVSRAEELEADLAVSEAETTAKRRSAADNRRMARDLRARAVKIVREPSVEPPPAETSCEPPYRFTSDGRKVYRIECLK